MITQLGGRTEMDEDEKKEQ
jgi:hypothetical protein